MDKVLLLIGNNQLKLINFNQLIQLNDDLIILDQYLIKGNNLKIRTYNEGYIELNGQIKTIEIKTE